MFPQDLLLDASGMTLSHTELISSLTVKASFLLLLPRVIIPRGKLTSFRTYNTIACHPCQLSALLELED